MFPLRLKVIRYTAIGIVTALICNSLQCFFTTLKMKQSQLLHEKELTFTQTLRRKGGDGAHSTLLAEDDPGVIDVRWAQINETK